jgi:SAM-dependent methyltransferase
MVNNYSRTWFDLFMSTMPQARTAYEVAFVARQLPRPRYHRLLDLACGTGRHARLLAEQGYDVLGIERDVRALTAAQEAASDCLAFLKYDMRDLAGLPGRFDGVICLWQSFGYFDASGNAAILQAIAEKLTPGGRCILDLYHRTFFEIHQGRRVFEVDGRSVVEDKHMRGDRLIVGLSYDGAEGDRFEWQLFRPHNLRALAETCGLTLRLTCTNFDEAQPASPTLPRVQYVLEKAVL